MKYKLFRRKAKGQSIPLIAIMIVVIVAMVGLSVDVGGAYAEQRSAVRAANAAAIAGMNAVIRNQDDSGIGTAIWESLKSNGIYASNQDNALTADSRKVTAFYLDASGNPLGGGCVIGTCGARPSGVTYIEVRVEGYTQTNFARVVGTQTLPINAKAFAAQCAPTSGVFPIAVNTSTLSEEGFKPPENSDELKYYGLYRDDTVPNGAYQRRIYLKDNATAPGQFSWLRWRSATNTGSATDTEASFSGSGTLSDGFDEAPWPSSGGSTWPKDPPAGYPINPGQLGPTDQDWAYGNSGLSWGPASDALTAQLNNRTIMILPIIDSESWGGGNNAQFRINRLGNFLIRGVGNEPGRGKYLDLVYVGATTTEACNNTPPPLKVDQPNPNLVGSLAVLPEARDAASKQPVQYAVVLDVSGSMNWNFNGQAVISGQVRQCGAGADANLNALRAQDFAACNTSTATLWSPVEERRIYVAKQSLMQFIDLIDPNDWMQVIAYSGAKVEAVGTSALGDAAGKAKLKQAVLDAGKTNGDPYVARGGTPTATGLLRAREILGAASTPKKAPNGQDYKQAVLLVTDGVANFYRDTNNGRYSPSGINVGWDNRAQDQYPRCEIGYSERPDCQTGYADTTIGKVARPLTAMVNEGTELQKNAQVFVIALAGVDATGLPSVASQEGYPWFAPANQAGSVDDVFRAINDQIENGDCQPAPYVGWTYEIDSAHTASGSDIQRLGGDPSHIYGTVRLLDSAQNEVARTAIKQEPIGSSTRLTYTFENVTPGTYSLSAVIYYKGDDGITRKYQLIRNSDLTTSALRSLVVQRGTSLNNTIAVDPLWMELGEAVCPRP
ncbi:MAG: VWA domain-containing protein [Roseiflexaceae bacterium]